MDNSTGNNKNIVESSILDVQGNLNIGDHTHYHIANTPFTLSTSRHFLTKVTSDLLDTTIPCFAIHQTLIDDFFKNPQKRIFLITGPNESGKTHLLRNLLLEAIQKNWICAGIESHALGAHPVAQLPENATLLLFKDDVEWENYDFLVPVLKFIDSHPNTRLVVTAHHSWTKQVYQLMQQIKDLPGKAHHIELEEWSIGYLSQLLRLASNVEEIKNEEDIVRQFPNPYLLKYFAEVNSGNQVLDVSGVRRNFAEKIRRVFEQNLQPELSTEKVQPFICHLVFNRIHSHLLSELAVIWGTTEATLICILERLKSAGIVRHRYGNWYITPEVKGDFYLANQLEQLSKSTIDGFLSPYLAENIKESVSKVIEGARYITDSSRKVIATYLKHLLLGWVRMLQDSPGEIMHSLHIATAKVTLRMELYYGVEIATDAACRLAIASLSITAPHLSNQNISNDDLPTIPFKGEDYGQFLEVLAYLPRKRDDYLSLLQTLWLTGWKTDTLNYQPTTLVSNAFQPSDQYNNVESYQIGLQYARSWLLQSGNSNLRCMAVKALQTMLGGFFEYTNSEYSSVTFGSIGLPTNEQLFQLRTEALELILNAMQDEALCLDCLYILEEIGQGKYFPGHNELFKLSAFPQIQKEIEQCIPVIDVILCDSQNFLVQKTAERVLLKWWLWGVSDNMESWLLNFKRAPEYILYCHVMDGRYMPEDFGKIKVKAPKKNRWKWYWKRCDLVEKRQYGSIEQYKGLVRKLSEKYKSPEQIALFIGKSILKIEAWKKMEGESNSMFRFNNIVKYWALATPKQFKQLIATPLLCSQLAEWTRIEIEEQLLAIGNYSIEEITLPLLSRIRDLTLHEMAQLVFIIQKHQPSKKEEWLTKMINEGQERMLHDIASRLCHIFKAESEVEKIAIYLLSILNSGKITQESFFGRNSFNNSTAAYRHLFNHLDLIPQKLEKQLRKVTFDWIKKISKLDSQEKDVIKYCIRETDHLIELFNYRADFFTVKNLSEKLDFQVEKVLLYDVFSIHELKEIFKTPKNHRRFIDNIQYWEKAAMIFSPDWRNHYIYVSDPASKELWIVQHLKRSLEENSLDAIERYCEFVPREDIYIDLMLKAWQCLIPTKSNKEMERMLYRWAIYRYRLSSYRADHNRYEYAKVFWEQLSKHPILDIRLKNIVQEIFFILESQWKEVQNL